MTSPIVLVPGFWLGAWAWDEVSDDLCNRGLVVSALTLPGLESVQTDRSSVGLADHVRSVLHAIEGTGEPVVLVLHSGAAVPGTAAADLLPDRVAALVYVDSGPAGTVDPQFAGTELALPSWQELEEAGTSAAGLTDEQREAFRSRAVPEPGAVVRGAVPLHRDGDRLDIPTTVVCCSMPSSVLVEAVAAGQGFAEPLGDLHDVTYVDLPTGHWPMFSRPQELAAIIAEVVAD